MVLTELNSSSGLSLVFIDPTVDNYIQLVAGVTPEAEVILLDRHRDGIAQISAALSDRDVSSLHIVSHGRPGEVQLGTACLSGESIARYQAALRQWRSSLRPNAEILLYGCSVAAGVQGAEFLTRLQAELGCAIAASSTPIGSSAKGGDWNLDVAIGTVGKIVFSPALTKSYASIFAEDNEADVLLEEDFEDANGETPPPGWESLTLRGNAETDNWRFDNPGNRTSIARALDDTFAIYDSDFLSDDDVFESVVLESPVFNATDAPGVFLQFDQFYGGIGTGINASTIFVESSTNGTDWTSVYSSNFDGNLINTPTIDLTEELAGEASAQVRFRFDGNWAFAWGVDNVRVVDYLTPGVNLPTEQVAVSETNVPDPLRFQFSLDSRPTADVTLNFVVDGQQLQSIAPLTFTPDNWNTPQTSIVRAVADNLVEGEDQRSNVQVNLVSADPNYNELQVNPVAVSITDSTIPNFNSYRVVEETYKDLANLAKANPRLATWRDIGDSYDKVTAGGANGYDIFALELGNKRTNRSDRASRQQYGSKGKPILFIQSSIHAREYTTAELVTRFAEQLVAGYGNDAESTYLLDHFDIRLVPYVNPDGRKLAEQGYSWRKNTNPTVPAGEDPVPFPSYGVDLNRNYASKWGEIPDGASTDPADLTYQGPAPFSEPESQTMRDYLLQTFRDRKGPNDSDPAPDDTAGIYYDVHSYGNLLLYPFGWTKDPAPNRDGLRSMGLKVGYFTGTDGEAYDVQQAIGLYPTSGTTDDWVYDTFGNASYTIELGTDFFESNDYFENTIVPEMMPAFFYSGKAAQKPYQLSKGPDSIEAALSADQVVKGLNNQVRLTVRADSTRYDDDNGNSGTDPNSPTYISEGRDLPTPTNVAGGRYSIDAPSWISGTRTFRMQAADGAFNSSIETLTANIDTRNLSIGRHTIFVESRDAQGNFGTPTPIFLDVLNAPSSARVSRGNGGDNVIVGRTSNDVVYGNGGDDTIRALSGVDLVLAGDGIDRVIGATGDDILYGGQGSDRINGGGGADKLYGDGGDDRLVGDAGDDQLWGGEGSDTLTGGAGKDIYKVFFSQGTDTIADFQVGQDLIDLGGTIGFDQVSVVQDGNNTRINFQKDTLAILIGVAANTITTQAFVPV